MAWTARITSASDAQDGDSLVASILRSSTAPADPASPDASVHAVCSVCGARATVWGTDTLVTDDLSTGQQYESVVAQFTRCQAHARAPQQFYQRTHELPDAPEPDPEDEDEPAPPPGPMPLWKAMDLTMGVLEAMHMEHPASFQSKRPRRWAKVIEELRDHMLPPNSFLTADENDIRDRLTMEAEIAREAAR